MVKSGRMRRCSQFNRKTGERCNNRIKAKKRQLRVFCKKHKKRHTPWSKTRAIIRDTVSRRNQNICESCSNPGKVCQDCLQGTNNTRTIMKRVYCREHRDKHYQMFHSNSKH